MKSICYPKEKWSVILKRPTSTIDTIEAIVNQIFEDVEKNGDRAIQYYTSNYDGIESDDFRVTEKEITIAIGKVPQNLKDAIQLAKTNIEKFHKAQQTTKVLLDTMNGVTCWQEKRPIQKVGLYIPGGTAPLFSTVLMLAVPATIAGCKEIVLCTPPNSQGKIADEILYAAYLCGVTTIFKVGGIQAIAGLTFGTTSMPQVYKIFGMGISMSR